MECLTTAEACAVLRCSRSTLLREHRRGHIIPIVRSTRRNLYRAEDLDNYLAERRVDQAATIAAAMALLAEAHAADTRPLCPECGKRRVGRGQSWCKWCNEQREAGLMDKRKYWHRTFGKAPQ